MRPSLRCIEGIKACEGCRLEAYKDCAGVWTIGYGHTDDVRPGDKITQSVADVFLQEDIDETANQVSRDLLSHVPASIVITQGMFDALVSFAFNLGATALIHSTLWNMLTLGDLKGAAREFGKWVYAGHLFEAGLAKRRAMERTWFEEHAITPQEV